MTYIILYIDKNQTINDVISNNHFWTLYTRESILGLFWRSRAFGRTSIKTLIGEDF